uniref:Dynein heavy chain, cytoplasmic n=1 Tax=Globisporangium ultimum (strain ATCC 200006 / CBS 805.95 / DAOM BR144) TaxID=431595 RepID=K3WUC5_GLOUD
MYTVSKDTRDAIPHSPAQEAKLQDSKISGTSGRKRKRDEAMASGEAVVALGGSGGGPAPSGNGRPQQQVIDLLPLDALRRYLQATCAPLFGEAGAQLSGIDNNDSSGSGSVSFAKDLHTTTSTAVLEQFIADSAARVLQVHYFSEPQQPESSRMEVDSDEGAANGSEPPYRIRVNLGIEYVAGKKRGHDVVCFIKRGSAPLTSDFALNHQLQVMTLALGKKKADTEKNSETGSSSGENTEEEEEDHGNLLSVMYNYVHQSFGPLVNEYSKVHQPQNELANMNEGARGLPAIKRKMKELELALLQYQQNIEIPEVNLVFHPIIQRAANLVREKGVLIDIEALGLEDKVNDVGFLNDIQGGVNKWIREIQKVTRLISEPLPGTAMQEINFWCDLNRALLGAQEKLNSPEVEITLVVLKRAKRYLATVTFSADHGLGPAIQRVASVMTLMKDFPMNSILSATDITQLNHGVTQVFTHLKKIRVADEYKLSRLLHLVEIMSSDLTQQVISVLRAYSLIQVPFEVFEQLIVSCKELFSNWHRQVGTLYDLTKELSKRRGSMNTDKPPLLSELQMEHTAIEERLLELYEFREQHEKLRQVIERVLGSSSAITAGDVRVEVTDDALTEINAAYMQLSSLDPLDVSGEGTTAWKNMRKSYELCIDRVEGRIINSLTSRLSATSNADEMFRVFSKYNALFFRPRIRSAVQQFQMQLIENVKQDVSNLQAKFRAHYAFSEASRTSKLRDIPPIAGAVMWAKQIERKLKMLLSRVESVLGVGWEQHVEGKALKVAAEAFIAKLNPQLIFDQWVNELASMPIFDIKNIILNIVTEDTPQGERKKLVVAFNQQIVTLFKEVRNLEWLGYRVPFTLKMIAEDAKSKYPFAMSLDASLKTYTNSCRRVQPIFEPLVASYIREVRAAIGKTFTKGNEMRWHADGLGEYVTDLATKVERLHDKVEELLQKSSDVDQLLDGIRKSDEFDGAEVQAVLAKIQSHVDELSLAGYANLNVFVKNLNQLIGGVLAKKLEVLLKKWVACFESGNDEKILQGIFEAANVTTRTHQILLKNQILYLEPSVDDARSVWLVQLQTLVNSVCDLPKIQTSSYENVYGKSTVSMTSPSRKSANAKRRESVFKEALAQVPQALIIQAYAVVDATIDEVQNYSSTWLQYQALWDMDAQTAINTVGEDLEKWQQILLEIKNERNSFDAVFNTKRFGPIVVNYQQVQAQVNVKYDAWHNEFLAHFGDLLCNQINSFYTTISSKRTLLEQHALEAATAQVVAAITLIQEMRVMRYQWQAALDSFSQGERLLKKQRFKFAADWPSLANVEGEWEAFIQLLDRKSVAMESQLPQLQAKILEEKSTLDQKVSKTVTEWDNAKPLQGGQSPKTATELLMVYDTRFKLLRADQEKMTAALEALSISFVGGTQLDSDRMGSSSLTRAMDELAGLDEVWKSISKVWTQVDELQETLWSAAQPRKIRKQLEELIDEMRGFPARVQQYEAFEYFTNSIQAKKSMNSLLSELKSDAIRDRHWKQILRLLRITSPFTELTLRSFWDSSLSSGDNELKQIIRTAQGEMALDEFLRQVVDYWTNYQLDLVNYQNRCRIIRGWDEMFAKLEEHLNSLSSMKQSPYYRVFAEQATSWEDKLTRIRGILDFWIDVQRRWVYLEGIFFGSADIKQQLPKEFARFQSIDNEFTSTMKRVAHKPMIVEVANIPNLFHALERQQEMMGNVQRALGEYLERQRAAFPRFYFVGDEDLLEMIGNSKEPLQIQRHLSKMFAGVSSLDIDSTNSVILGMVSREGEVVKFRQPVKTQEDTRVNIWLSKVEDQMRQTLSQLLDESIRSYPAEDNIERYIKWVSEFPAQVIILATQVQWSRAVENALKSGGQDLPLVLNQLDGLLRILSERVLSDVKNDVRRKYEQLITELVHQKSVTKRLLQANVGSVDDFRWLYHMRYYFHAGETDPLKKLSINVSNASFSYGFEYLGVGERLVSTPLTERCYLTLTQALDFGMGGNPFGPAGTGKTESVKALGSQLGRFVLVFNCDEHFDFQAMGRIFVGLCQVGAWGCFDEFNRLEERVLSAVSQQILAIQSGVSSIKTQKQPENGTVVSASGTTTIELLGKSVKLHPDVGIFVTMNPGYAGRSNLPDNLKQLFRSIAMVAPDRELIAQVMLFSQGIVTAEQISAKVVLLFNLCEDQLSKQPHYDFGLRALKSVLVSAGQLKRKISQNAATDTTMEELETKALIGSISDTILPKLVAHDVPVFETLLKGVFPGTETHRIQEDVLRTKIVELAQKNYLVAHEQWVEKALQLYQVMQLRHGVMLVGPSGTGKSAAWRILLEALELFDGKKGEAHVIDPKALSKEHLYGVLDNTTLEWTDGVFTNILRQVLNSVRGESEKRHWIIFDGDVDPEWAENLNSVLDDNRLLTLPSGERLEIPPNVWIMMETETLRYATLATVSRCGMVWFSSDTVQTHHIVEHYLQKIRDDTSTVSSFSLQPSETETMRKSAHTYVALIRDLISRGDGMPSVIELCLEHSIALKHIMDVTALRQLMSMFSLLARGLSRINEYNEAHSDFPMTAEQISSFGPKWLVFSIIWGFGGSMDSANRIQLCEFVIQTLENRIVFPVSSSAMSNPENSLLEYEVNIDDGEWRQWVRSIPQLDLESHRVLSTDVVVTTVDTIRHVEVLRGWLSQHRPLILCGPPGSGKTMTLTSTLSSLPEFEFASLNFSSGTSPDLILKTFAQYCEYKRTPNGMVLAPNAPEKWLVVFCDEINLPEADRYGTQRVITFLRQLIEQGGFWLGGKNTWVRLQRIQFVGACNPPTDPGRVPISHRLLRHAPILLVDFPSYPSLKQIYGTFNNALLKLTPSLKSYVQPLTNAMVDVYHRNQTKFTAEIQPHYIYSPRELSRWMRALYEAIEPLEYEIEVETLVKLVFHEALRLFMDRLVTPEEQKWCFDTTKEILRMHFPQSATSFELVEYGGQNPVLFSTWLSKHYTEVSTLDLRKHIEARLRVFYEEELNVPLVVFDSVIAHVLRIDRVLRQPLGHLLLVGESGAGKTVLSRFVSWMNGISVFQIKLTSNYTLENFDDDLRVVLKRCGCEGEKICFIFDESNVLGSAFLERMNALLASGEVPGLFEDDEYTSLMHACREAVQRDGVMVENTEDELFRYFTKQVQRNLHVVFTMNPASGDFQNRNNTSPALFNRCVVDWFGTWNNHALAQVAYEFTNTLDLPGLSSGFQIPVDAEEILARLVPHIATGSFRDVLVASIVQFHHAVLQHMRRLQKRHMKYNHISPRDYLEFIRHFVTLYSEKRAQLEDQQLHLNVGVQKLQATHEQVAELQGQLSLKEKELKKKDIEANEKLQQMIREQNEAQEKKKDTEKLAADLAQKDLEISERKKVAEADLAQAEPALLEAQASVNSIRKSQLDEIRALARPPVAVRLAVEAVAVMLGETSLDWADLRRFIRKDDFISSVVNFDSQKLTARQRHTIQTNYVENSEDFEYEKIQPLREEVQALIEKSADLRKSYESAKKTIDALEVRIENYKHEYASLINEAQIITNDMAQVNKKVERSVALLNNLLQESERWEAGSNDFDTQMKTLVGDTLLCSGFLTYIGFLDFQQRKILVQDWRDILDTMGIASKPQLSFVDYLSRPSEQLEWQMSELPSDELCYENAIILQRFHRFPLIIDPSGQANNFIMRYYALKTNKKIAQTSFLDSSFMKVLASAIRFGTALLVHEVEKIDPILNPVLNRELYKTGGRVLIRLGGEEIDYSPDFRLFLITRDPSCRFSPDICSRVTFVNFTVTPSSLESQGLSILMKSEQPEVEEKRNNLLKLQGEYQAKLRDLEDSLLQQINNVQGNILDDDSVINALEGMKAEAAHISEQVEQTQNTMNIVEAATSRYRPLAKASSRLFFALENLSSIHFLYQYSLDFFMSLLTKVLSLPHEVKEDGRLDGLSNSLFYHTAARVSRGLAESDKLMFALRMSQIYLELQQETVAVTGSQLNAGAPFDGPLEEELDILLGTISTFLRPDVEASRSEFQSLLPAFSKAEIEQLLKLLQIPSFKHLESHVRDNASEWNAFVKQSSAEKYIPEEWDATLLNSSVTPRRAAFRNIILIHFLRPDRVIYAAETYVSLVFGSDFPWRGEIELRKNIENDTQATRAVLLSSKPGFDASAQIDELAVTLQKKYNSVSMGSAEGFDAAEKGLNTALKSGTWLLLRNVHLCPSWLVTVEKKLYNARDSAHPNFRLFLTSEIHPNLPVNLLRMCDIFVFEPPSGMKLSMVRTLDTVSADRMNKTPAERARLYLLLAWFHALVHERLRYVPVGWSKTYEFSQSDFRGACDVIDRWVNSVGLNRAHVAPDNIPWTAIRTTLKESVYGGRVDNEFDQELMDTLLEHVFTPDSYQNTFELVSAGDEKLLIAEGKTKQQFMEWIHRLPSTNPPSWMGLPRSAETMVLISQGSQTLRNLQLMQDFYGSEADATGAEEESMVLGTAAANNDGDESMGEDMRPKWVQDLDRRVDAWSSLFPGSLPTLSRDPGNFSNPIYRCMFREVELGSEYLATVTGLLSTIKAVCSYTTKPTNDIREAMQTLYREKIPSQWLQLYRVSTELILSEWLADFSLRIRQLDQLARIAPDELLQTPNGIWLGGLFSPEAFVTAARQSVAAALTCSLDELQLVAEIQPSGHIGSFGVSGLQLEGASWTASDILPSDIIRNNLSLLHLRWSRASELANQTGYRRLPVYASNKRDHLLFSVSVQVDSAKFPTTQWIQRSIALVLWQLTA